MMNPDERKKELESLMRQKDRNLTNEGRERMRLLKKELNMDDEHLPSKT